MGHPVGNWRERIDTIGHFTLLVSRAFGRRRNGGDFELELGLTACSLGIGYSLEPFHCFVYFEDNTVSKRAFWNSGGCS